MLSIARHTSKKNPHFCITKRQQKLLMYSSYNDTPNNENSSMNPISSVDCSFNLNKLHICHKNPVYSVVPVFIDERSLKQHCTTFSPGNYSFNYRWKRCFLYVPGLCIATVISSFDWQNSSVIHFLISFKNTVYLLLFYYVLPLTLTFSAPRKFHLGLRGCKFCKINWIK